MVICQFHEAGCRLSVSHMRQDDVYVSYIRQDDGYLSVTSGRLVVICHLHEAG